MEDISERKYLNHIQYKKHEKINTHVTNTLKKKKTKNIISIVKIPLPLLLAHKVEQDLILI